MSEPFSLRESALDRFVGCLNEKSLHDLAERELGPKAIARLDDLADKANEGTLTPDGAANTAGTIILNSEACGSRAAPRAVAPPLGYWISMRRNA